MASFEEKIFQGRQLAEQKLLEFGFVREGKGLIYQCDLLDGDFQAIIRVDDQGKLSGRLIDSELGEDYTVFRTPQATGQFVGQVRQAYQELLEEIADFACQNLPLKSAQGRRLDAYICDNYGDQGASPFEKFPNIYAFRNPFNEKWYALALELVRGKLDLGVEVWSEEDLSAKVEVVNLKIQPERLHELLAIAGIYPSYHMNKKHWVTVSLDDRVSDALLFDLIATSRYLTLPKKEQKKWT